MSKITMPAGEPIREGNAVNYTGNSGAYCWGAKSYRDAGDPIMYTDKP
ncbi:hypothetical protein [Zhongshania sp.]|nr:hypothetical protein [Zhongshania sp.]